MKICSKLLLIISFYFIASCSSSKSFHKDFIQKDTFAFGRIKIYQVYSDRKMREISSKCYISNNQAIERGLLSKEPSLLSSARYDYMLEHGLLVFKPKFGTNFVIEQINCNPDSFATTVAVKNFYLLTNFNQEEKINYFGDIDIFISSNYDDKYTLKCVGNACGYSVQTTLYYYPKKILISNNQKETYDYLNSKLGENNKNNLEISYQPIKMKEKNETKSIPESKKKMPF